MLSKEDLLDVVKQYPLGEYGYKRERYLAQLKPALNMKEIIILKGVRRCGKTTMMKQMINHLLEEGVKSENILYVNLDDFNFLPHLSIGLLEFILSTRNLKEMQYLFLDEIQRIPGFESWLRTHYDRNTNAKFIISGSNSSLLAKDLASLLTGRNLTFEIWPLDFTEFRQFTKSEDLNSYLEFGGFPAVVLEGNVENKLNLLRNYVSDIINKDILLRERIRDQAQLTLFAQYILKNPGVRLSINRLSKQTGISKDTVKKYLEYLMNAYLIFEVPFFSYSAKERFVPGNMPKYYLTDLGFYKVAAARKDLGKMYENIVAQALHRRNKELFYWKDKNEVDFISENNAYNVTSTDNIPERELQGLKEIKGKHKHIKRTTIICPSKETKEGEITFVPLQKFLNKLPII
jgi:predicted AAA+ superfamily ATPase